MLKKRYLLIFTLLLCSNLISVSWFNSIDSSNDNYIQIGTFNKKVDVPINGMIFKYNNSEKIILSPSKWFSRASFTSLGNLIYLNQNYYSVNIRKISYFDLISLTTDYVIALHTQNVQNSNGIFDLNHLTITISTDYGNSYYKYDDLKNFIKSFCYSPTSHTIIKAKNTKVSCAVIDMSNILKKHIKSEKLWINIRTPKGNITFKIKE